MDSLRRTFLNVDATLTQWTARHGVTILRVSLGVVFLWFGALKFIPGLSPAEELATRTIDVLTFGKLLPPASSYILAVWESLIGIGLITNIFMRATLLLLFVQMIGAATPLVLFPRECFAAIPFVPTLEGQYIIKNVVLVSAALVVGATVRGGRIIADPHAAKQAELSSGQAS